jgi:hypothetical protein
VCSLQWGRHEKELVSAHGFSQNQLTVWRAQGVGAATVGTSTGATSTASPLVKMADLTGHTARILHTTLSPDGTTVCSAGADETLRFWKVCTCHSIHSPMFVSAYLLIVGGEKHDPALSIHMVCHDMVVSVGLIYLFVSLCGAGVGCPREKGQRGHWFHGCGYGCHWQGRQWAHCCHEH